MLVIVCVTALIDMADDTLNTFPGNSTMSSTAKCCKMQYWLSRLLNKRR